MTKTFADFFAGIGLARLGLARAGWTPVFANDIDTKKAEMYEDQFGSLEHYHVCDVTSLDEAQVDDARLWWASFPCTDLSLAGGRRGLAGKQSGALLGFLDLLKAKNGQRPEFVVLENVPGFLTSHGGADFAMTIQRLNALGYTCDAFVLDALRFVPQSRMRLFIVATFDAPRTCDAADVLRTRSEALRSPLLDAFVSEHDDLKWRINAMPAPPSRTALRLADIVQHLPATSVRWWWTERVEYLVCQMTDRHLDQLRQMTSARRREYGTVYRRMRYGKSRAELRTDGISGCLRTPRGGSSRQILVEASSTDVRARFMTPREYARLMGAGDYKIRVSDKSVLRVWRRGVRRCR